MITDLGTSGPQASGCSLVRESKLWVVSPVGRLNAGSDCFDYNFAGERAVWLARWAHNPKDLWCKSTPRPNEFTQVKRETDISSLRLSPFVLVTVRVRAERPQERWYAEWGDKFNLAGDRNQGAHFLRPLCPR